MKFKIGDKVKEIHPPYQVGEVIEVQEDKSWAGGVGYLIDFGGDEGNQWSNGEIFVIVETDFI